MRIGQEPSRCTLTLHLDGSHCHCLVPQHLMSSSISEKVMLGEPDVYTGAERLPTTDDALSAIPSATSTYGTAPQSTKFNNGQDHEDYVPISKDPVMEDPLTKWRPRGKLGAVTSATATQPPQAGKPGKPKRNEQQQQDSDMEWDN
ncbi:hypothetical protein WOLCODRAFT_160249 [Wolfiporia cocos MD-104 SS10]|uniref:Uncharacterized protein n=1 Tax=Wolfiporia cocos (strain MD-104) TaxID=742152 RepID=A0A2H3J1K0_WOLCO|nr:hypothetical protein WOLCODRAFT_160249 [Wolfiporia cocos MD-104 SS10]